MPVPSFDPLAGVALVGDAHRTAVDELSNAYRQVTYAWRPRLVNLTAETGVGKTRIVQEFYQRFAATDPYWPPTLIGPNGRKEVAPDRGHWSGSPDALWLGILCLRDDAGRVIPVLEAALPRQARVHANGLLLRAKRARARKGAAVAVVKAAAGWLPVTMVEQALEAVGKLGELRDIATEIEEAIEPVDTPVAEIAVNEEAVEALLAILDALNAIGMAVVVVVDDAHNADATTLAVIERLLEGARGALVVTTSWPTALATQRQSATGFGALLARLEPRSRIDELALAAPTQDELAELASLAWAPRQQQLVAARAAQIVAARADHNPLLLADLLRIVRANGFELTEAHTEHLARLPQGFQKIYQAVWSVFLSEAARAHLQLAAALGMPVHEGLLRMGATAVPAAQPTDLAAHAQDPLDEALRAGWLTAVADPFSDDRTLHFSERVMHDVASAFAVELLEPTRCNAVNRVARAALELDATSSSVARLDALRYAARLCLSDLTRPAALHLPMLICEIGRLHWERDRSEGADWLRSAVRCAAKFESPDLDQIAASAADAFTNLDRFDEALEMLALGGDPLLGHVVYVLNVADRYDDVAVAAQRALDVELPRRGVLLFIGRIGREHVVAEIAELALDAAVRTQDADLKQRAVAVARRAIDDALDRELWAEAAEIADAGIQAESFDRNDLAAFEARGMPTVSTMTPQELLESPLVERDAVGELVERLVADDYDGAADSASHIDTPEELTEALPHLHRLIEQGGPNYWYDLGAAALYVGDHATAVDALERAVTHHRSQFAETDHEVQRIAFAFARALVGHEDFERGAAVARRAVEVAEAVGNDRLLAEALWVRVETLTAAGALSDADAYADLQRLWALMISGGMQLFPMVRVFDPVACALLRTANDRGDREQMAAISGELRDLILPPSFYLELAAWRLVALWQTDPAVVLHTASLLAANHGLPAADTARDRLGRLAADGAQAIHEALTSSTRTLYDLMDELPPWSRLLTGDHGVTAWSERLVVCGAIAQERRMLADWPVLAAEQRSVALAEMGQAWADVAAVLGAPTYLAEALLARYQGAGRTEEAIVIIGPLLATCERRLNACVRLLGPEHPDTLRTRDDLATVYQAAGRTADAKRVHRAAP